MSRSTALLHLRTAVSYLDKGAGFSFDYVTEKGEQEAL